ncbi:MAG: hypothetical protein M1817_001315 [Caeruleum heppii]|nr:MAG: hypothetical protein M1817_001315 [Caeruleum heppii]
MVLDNDERGWIMAFVSGIACVVGSSIICVDLLIQKIPSKQNFRIQDSSAFLSSSLSLSFGVMLFSALYSILPSSKASLKQGGFSPELSAWILIGSFLGGVIVIQIVSRVMHHYIPSHVVDCDHTHDEETKDQTENVDHGHADSRPHSFERGQRQTTPLLHTSQDHPNHVQDRESRHTPFSSGTTLTEAAAHSAASAAAVSFSHRPSLKAQLTSRVSSLVTGGKASCDETGPCFGYSDPCGQACLKRLPCTKFDYARSPHGATARPCHSRRATAPVSLRTNVTSLEDLREEGDHDPSSPGPTAEPFPSLKSRETDGDIEQGRGSSESDSVIAHDSASPHHHHVPTNAFYSIGLQTSIAIALHKLPEGFITFATNHANPRLGFSVFMALFIHNITEGFALALPLYLALNSRWKAMLWSSFLGGASQPLGALAAATWFKVAGTGDMTPGEGVYGVMFAVTSGIMTSVALQLFSEGLDLSHNRSVCIVFAFLGMAILGISFALTAE